MKITTLEGLLVDELKDIYSAETQMIKALPRLAEAAESNDLRAAFKEHLEQTRGHAVHIEQICEKLKAKPGGKKCLGMEGLIKEAEELVNGGLEGEILEAALIGAAQRVEHYEIAAYGTAHAHARQLGFMNVADLLGLILEEEKKTDQRLTSLAENKVNVQAAMLADSLVI
jgi:ferritin-like metal-binding protein YciE